MKIVFFGTNQFAVTSLEAICNSGHEVTAVVTQSDKKKGRGLKLAFSAVKVFAEKRGLKIYQPSLLKEESFIKTISKINPEVLIVVSYGKILPKEVLEIPKIYAINLHASLLPKYRGAAPVNWAIINGEAETGVTIIKMNEYMDRGDILTSRKVKIEPEDTAGSLSDRLAGIGADSLLKTIELIEAGKVVQLPQDNKAATFAPRIKKSDARIDWSKTSTQVSNFIRGMNPHPGAFSYIGKKIIKIWKTKSLSLPESYNAGEIVELKKEQGMVVSTGKGCLLITELQLEGKKRMGASEFLRGHKVKIGQKLG